MTPDNPELSLNQQGHRLALLHEQLNAIGRTISPVEVQAQAFGPTTQQAAFAFQKEHRR